MGYGEMRSREICRRAFLSKGVAGVGLLGLNSLLNRNLLGAPGLSSRGVVNPLHHAPKAKRVIFLYQAGGPSHLETWDYKPKLAEMHGQPMPESVQKRAQPPAIRPRARDRQRPLRQGPSAVPIAA